MLIDDRALVDNGFSDLAELLGHHVLEPWARGLCARYGLIPRDGTAPARSYLARDAGVELSVDGLGQVTTVFLHFHGDDGFASYRGAVPHRSALWAELGPPVAAEDPQWDRFLGSVGPAERWDLGSVVVTARYALDGERLHRITLTRP